MAGDRRSWQLSTPLLCLTLSLLLATGIEGKSKEHRRHHHPPLPPRPTGHGGGGNSAIVAKGDEPPVGLQAKGKAGEDPKEWKFDFDFDLDGKKKEAAEGGDNADGGDQEGELSAVAEDKGRKRHRIPKRTIKASIIKGLKKRTGMKKQAPHVEYVAIFFIGMMGMVVFMMAAMRFDSPEAAEKYQQNLRAKHSGLSRV